MPRRSKGQEAAKKRRTITLSVEEDILDDLETESKTKNTSLNSTINVILSKYVSYYRRAEQVGTVTLSSSAFYFFLAKVDENEFANVIYDATSEMIPLIFHELNLPITIENVVTYLYQNIAVNSGIYNSVILYKDAEGYPCLLLRHSHGEKWSRIAALHTRKHMEELLKCHVEMISLGPTSVVVKFLDKGLY